MSLSITIELSEADLQHFQEIVRRAHESAGAKSSDEITKAASALVEAGHGKDVPEFIAQRLGKLGFALELARSESACWDRANIFRQPRTHADPLRARPAPPTLVRAPPR